MFTRKPRTYRIETKEGRRDQLEDFPLLLRHLKLTMFDSEEIDKDTKQNCQHLKKLETIERRLYGPSLSLQKLTETKRDETERSARARTLHFLVRSKGKVGHSPLLHFAQIRGGLSPSSEVIFQRKRATNEQRKRRSASAPAWRYFLSCSLSSPLRYR